MEDLKLRHGLCGTRFFLFAFLFVGTPAITARCRLRNVAVPEFRTTTNESLKRVRVQSCVEIRSYRSAVRRFARKTGKNTRMKEESVYFALIHLALFILIDIKYNYKKYYLLLK